MIDNMFFTKSTRKKNTMSYSRIVENSEKYQVPAEYTQWSHLSMAMFFVCGERLQDSPAESGLGVLWKPWPL